MASETIAHKQMPESQREVFIKALREDALNSIQIRSEELFAHASTVIIMHQGCAYRLQITGNQKLILTK